MEIVTAVEGPLKFFLFRESRWNENEITLKFFVSKTRAQIMERTEPTRD